MPKNSQIHTLKLDAELYLLPTLRSFTPAEGSTHTHVRALVALIGGYNSQAREVDVDRYHEIRDRFNDCISELAGLLDENTPAKPVKA